MEIRIYGTGCAKCKKLFESAEAAVQMAGVDATVVKVDQVADIAADGVMFTPAIGIDGVIKASGKVVPPERIVQWLK